MPVPELVYKIATAELAGEAARTGVVAGMPVDRADGYVHLSTAAQLPATLALHFRGQRDLVLFAVRTAALGDALRFEPSRGGDLFPHLYAPLAMAAVAHQAGIAVAADGACPLPEWVQ